MFAEATAFNFAAAVAVAKNWDNYVSLPTDHASMFYWWVPDTTFLRSDLKLTDPTSQKM